MEKVYIIKSNHSYNSLLDFGITKKAFKSKERCDEIISQIAEKEYGKPVYSENSKYVKIVTQYWSGDFSMEEAKAKISKEADAETVFNSALYYDFKNMFRIEEYQIED